MNVRHIRKSCHSDQLSPHIINRRAQSIAHTRVPANEPGPLWVAARAIRTVAEFRAERRLDMVTFLPFGARRCGEIASRATGIIRLRTR
jgi:hypothetical protein